MQGKGKAPAKGKGKGKGKDGQSKAAFRRQQGENAARAADRMIKEGAKKWANTKKAVSPLHEVLPQELEELVQGLGRHV